MSTPGKYPKISATARMILAVLAELFMSLAATVAGATAQQQATTGQPVTALPAIGVFVLGAVIGLGRAWGEVKRWVDAVTAEYDV